MKKYLLLCVFTYIIVELLLLCSNSYSLPLFSRKYKKACFDCHTAIPRINEFGEQFLFNGFQDIKRDPDGGETAKFIPSGDKGMLTLDIHIPITINIIFNPFIYNNNIRDDTDKKVRPKFSLGANSAEGSLLAAGTYNKNLSYYFESVIMENGTELEQMWVQISNLWKANYFHLRFGLLPITDYSSFPFNRRIVREEYFIMDNNSKTAGNSGLRLGGVQSAVELHGKPFGEYSLAYSIAVFNGGKNTTDVDNFKDYSVMLRYDFNDMFNISVLGIFGTDTKENPSGSNNRYETDRIKSNVGIYQFAANFRYGGLDIYGEYVVQEDDNALYSDSSTGYGGLVGSGVQMDYYILKDIMVSGRYDDRREKGVLKDTGRKAVAITPQITYLLTQNVLFRLSYKIDMQGQFNVADKRYLNQNNVFNVFFNAVF